MDFVKDNNHRPLYTAMLAMERLPDYAVKQARITPEDTAGLAEAAFADPAVRELPVHTKQAAYLSAVDFLFRDVPRPAGALGKIKQAASLFGITEDVEELEKAAATYFTSPEVETSCVLLVDSTKIAGMAEGERVGLYPAQTVPAMLDSAESAAYDYETGKLPMQLFRKAAMAFCKLAAVAGVSEDLPGAVVRMGADRLPDFDNAASAAAARKLAGVDGDVRDIYVDIVKAARAEYASSGGDEAVLERWIDAWIELDKGQGVKYSRLVENPYEAFFSGPDAEEVEKMAAETVVVGDVLVPAVDFSSVPESFVRTRFAPETADRIVGWQKQAAYDAPGVSREMAGLEDDVRRRVLRMLAES